MKCSIAWFDRLPSTNTFLREELRQQPAPKNGAVFAAREQTAGRGRCGRTWQTAPGTNLCFSIFVETDCALMDVPSCTMAAALGITDYLNGRGIPAAPKWPNDVLVGGRKICGILSERVETDSTSGIIVGIGLNVNMSTEQAEAIDRPATSMLIETGTGGDLTRTLEELLPYLGAWIDQWKPAGFPAIRSAWTERAGPIGKPLQVHDGALRKSGTLAGFGDYGELLLRTEQGIETIWSGDVS